MTCPVPDAGRAYEPERPSAEGVDQEVRGNGTGQERGPGQLLADTVSEAAGQQTKGTLNQKSIRCSNLADLIVLSHCQERM